MSRASVNMAALALLLSASVTAGCGSSKTTIKARHVGSQNAVSAVQGAPSSDQSRKALSRSELIAQADAICGAVNARRASIKIRSAQDYKLKVPGLASYESTAFADLARLVPPASMASDWRQIVRASQAIARYTTKAGELAKQNNLARLRPLMFKGARLQEQMMATAKRAGFRNCAQG